jgi:hypothetical protein
MMPLRCSEALLAVASEQKIVARSCLMTESTSKQPARRPLALAMFPALVTAAGILSGCVDNAPTFHSRLILRQPPAIDRLVVLLDTGGSGDWYAGVQAGLADALGRCGIQPTVLSSDPLELEPVERALEAAKAVHATALLVIAGRGATARFTEYAGQRTLTFELWIVDLVSRKVAWVAEASLGMATGPDLPGFSSDSPAHVGGASGGQFATRIVAQLQADLVLTRCRRPAPPPPDPSPRSPRSEVQPRDRLRSGEVRS